MKIGTLYHKILISFLVILIVTEALIFTFFIIAAGRAFRSRLERYVVAQTQVAKEFIEEKIKASERFGSSPTEDLRDFVSRLGTLYGARTWITGPDGRVVAQSFSGPAPSLKDDASRYRAHKLDDIELFQRSGKERSIWAVAPLDMGSGGAGSLNIVFERPQKERPPEGVFALGLLIIGVIIAVLIIPVSRFITKPLKRLKRSALELAEGDLSSRAPVKSRDEIGDLAKSFNLMADTMEKMIQGHRELTANISHELRSPLARIRIAQELIGEKLRRSGGASVESELRDIGEDIEELDRLIGKILDLSKMDIRDDKLDVREIDLREITEDLLARFGTAFERSNLRVVHTINAAFIVRADKTALRTALSNIIDNAVKYTASGGSVTLDAFRQKGRVLIEVTNTHGKLSEEELTGIFEPFHRMDRTRSGGSGLGLAIAGRIAEKHGGASWAENAEQGLKVTVSLPD